MITLIKSVTAREVFRERPEVKKQLWGENSGAMDILSTQ